MKETEIEALEKRVAALEKGMAELRRAPASAPVVGWKGWRIE